MLERVPALGVVRAVLDVPCLWFPPIVDHAIAVK